MEVRAVIQDLSQKVSSSGGTLEPVNIEELIEAIYVAPNAPGWYFDLVQKTAVRYGLSANVVQSALSEKPVY